MPVLSKNYVEIHTREDFLAEYGSVRCKSDRWGQEGELHYRDGTIVFCLCNKCHTSFTIKNFKRILDRVDSSTLQVYCGLCARKATSKILYGVDNFTNREKSIKTYVDNHSGPSPKKLHKKGFHQPAFTLEHRRKISEFQKTRKGEKAAGYKKHHSTQTRRKISESVSRSIAKKILEGSFNFNTRYDSGHMHSAKNNKVVHYRSSYEKRFFLLLEYATEIEEYVVEPVFIPYFIKGLKKHYIPDVLIKYRSGVSHLVEIKPEVFTRDIVNLLKFNAAKKFVVENSIDEFFVLTEGDFWRYLLCYSDSFFYNLPKSFLESAQKFICK